MAPKPPRLESLMSCRDLPIRYMMIPKCGCTFIKNLIWRLDHGETYLNPTRIHDRQDEFARAAQFDLTVEDIRAEDFAFVVLRNPVDRFLSLYFDKVVGEGWRKYVPLRKVLAENHGLDIAPQSAADHTRNLTILIDWLDENLTGKNELVREAHWTPQNARMETIRGFDLKVLPINGLNGALVRLLSPVVPDIQQMLGGLERYATNSKEKKDEVLDNTLRARIKQVYRRDAQNYDRLREVWKELDPKTAQEIPRASRIFD